MSIRILLPSLGLLLAGCRAAPIPDDAGAPSRQDSASTAIVARAPAASRTAAPSPLPEATFSPSPAWPMAPDLDATGWLNSERLQMSELRGKVVVIDFWTFG